MPAGRSACGVKRQRNLFPIELRIGIKRVTYRVQAPSEGYHMTYLYKKRETMRARNQLRLWDRYFFLGYAPSALGRGRSISLAIEMRVPVVAPAKKREGELVTAEGPRSGT